jgi:predicted metal-dependent hydrolase
MDFIGRTGPWLERRLASHMRAPDRAWREGSEILLAGRGERIEATPLGARLGPLFVAGSFQPGEDLRPYFEPQLRRLAEKELPLRTQTLADAHGLRISRVSVRNQKSRWGSCSSRGVISLNWQLIRTPDYVRDYIILHELMHLRQMNHSARFWREVESVCPDWRRAEAWLKGPGRELLR